LQDKTQSPDRAIPVKKASIVCGEKSKTDPREVVPSEQAIRYSLRIKRINSFTPNHLEVGTKKDAEFVAVNSATPHTWR